MKKINKKVYKRKLLKKQILILLLILIFITIIIVFGRFLTSSIKDFFVRSREFYFYSDKLSEDTAIFQIDNWSGVDDYVITINMNSLENNLKSTSYDISYSIQSSCSDNAICELSKTEGIIYANTNNDIFTVTITPTKQLKTGDKVEVEIVADSTSKYKKTLKGKFTLVVGKENLSYQITDASQSPYLELRITNTLTYYNVSEPFDSYTVGQKIDSDTYLGLSDINKAKCYSVMVTLNFDPSKVLLDITNEEYQEATNIVNTQINGKNYVSGFTIEIDAISSINLRFYKTDVTKDYTYPNNNSEPSIIMISSQ